MPLHRFSPARRTLLKHSGAIAATSFIGTMGALYSRNAFAATGKQLTPAASLIVRNSGAPGFSNSPPMLAPRTRAAPAVHGPDEPDKSGFRNSRPREIPPPKVDTPPAPKGKDKPPAKKEVAKEEKNPLASEGAEALKL